MKECLALSALGGKVCKRKEGRQRLVDVSSTSENRKDKSECPACTLCVARIGEEKKKNRQKKGGAIRADLLHVGKREKKMKYLISPESIKLVSS